MHATIIRESKQSCDLTIKDAKINVTSLYKTININITDSTHSSNVESIVNITDSESKLLAYKILTELSEKRHDVHSYRMKFIIKMMDKVKVPMTQRGMREAEPIWGHWHAQHIDIARLLQLNLIKVHPHDDINEVSYTVTALGHATLLNDFANL